MVFQKGVHTRCEWLIRSPKLRCVWAPSRLTHVTLRLGGSLCETLRLNYALNSIDLRE